MNLPLEQESTSSELENQSLDYASELPALTKRQAVPTTPEKRIYFCDSRQSAVDAVGLSKQLPGILVPTTSVAAHQLAQLEEDFRGIEGERLWTNPVTRPERRLSLYKYLASALVEVLCGNGRQREEAEVIVDTFMYHAKLTIDFPMYLSVLLENCDTPATKEVLVPVGSTIEVDHMGLIRSECSLLEAVMPTVA